MDNYCVQILNQTRRKNTGEGLFSCKFLDSFINQLEERFKGRSNQALKALFLIPSHLKLMNNGYLKDIKTAHQPLASN